MSNETLAVLCLGQSEVKHVATLFTFTRSFQSYFRSWKMASVAFLCLYMLTLVESTWREEIDPETGYLMLIKVGSTETITNTTAHLVIDNTLRNPSQDTILRSPRISNHTIPCTDTIEKSEAETPAKPNGFVSNSTYKRNLSSVPRRRRNQKRERLKIKSPNVSHPSPEPPPPTVSPTTSSPTISMERLDKGISFQNRKNRKSIKSSNETDDDILKQHMEQQHVLHQMKSNSKGMPLQRQHQTPHNRTSVTMYGLVSTQQNLHGLLHTHLLCTKKSNLFLSMVQVPDSELPQGMISHSYWTHLDEVWESLTEILSKPNKWCNVKEVKDLMIHTLNYFALWKDVEDVDMLVMLMSERYSNKSKEHHQLCQDIRYSILLFRRIAQRAEASLDSKGKQYETKLSITIDTLDLVGHWWIMSLCMISSCFLSVILKLSFSLKTLHFELCPGAILRKTNEEVKWLLEDTKYGQHNQDEGLKEERRRAMDFFRNTSDRIAPDLEQYTQFVGSALISGKGTKFEFIRKAAEMGISIHARFQIITSMKHHWLIAMYCFDWIRAGNVGEITVILPVEQSMSLMHALLRDIGIHEEDQMIIRVEQQMQIQRLRDVKRKKGMGKKGRIKGEEVVVFRMQQISYSEAARLAQDGEQIDSSKNHKWPGK